MFESLLHCFFLVVEKMWGTIDFKLSCVEIEVLGLSINCLDCQG